MKKVFLTLALLASSFLANAQFSVGASLGLPVGVDVSDYTFSLSVDATYMIPSYNDISFGFASGYTTYISDNLDNAAFLPLAGAIRLKASQNIKLCADFGYAVGLSPKGNDGGFYYKPMVEYIIGETTSVNVFYSGINVNAGTFANIGLGVMFAL